MAKKNNSSPKAKSATKAKSSTAKKSSGGGTGNQKPAGVRILEAIASQMALGHQAADREMVQGLAGMPSKGSFNTTLLNLKNKGWVTYDSMTVSLTDAGIEKVGPEATSVPPTNDAMQDKMKELIKQKKAREIFDILADGRFYSRPELAEKMGLEDNKSFGTYVSALSKLVERENGKMRLKDKAFPCGRPCGA